MVSANPNRPKVLVVSESWIRPTKRPTSSPDRELPPRACSTTTTRKTSTVRPKAGHRLMPTKWTRAARAMAASSLRVSTGAGLLESRGEGLVIQEIDLVEGAEIDGRGDLDLVEELAALHR